MIRVPIVAAVIRREFLEVARNRLLLLSIVVPPAILAALPVVLFGVLGAEATVPPEFVEHIVASHPQWADLTPSEVAAAFAIQQFLVTYLVLPGYIPLAIATYSVVGEKQSRSLEAVLATPVRTSELLGGKAVAALIPGLIASWVAYVLMVALTAVVLGPRSAAVVLEPTWLAAVLALGPAIGLLCVTAGIIVSSRVNDPRTAQQIGAVILLPAIGLVVVQAVGAFVVEATAYLLLAAVMTLLAVALLRLGAAVFGRESILTRWK